METKILFPWLWHIQLALFKNVSKAFILFLNKYVAEIFLAIRQWYLAALYTTEVL
jgi:hypothetical protein